MNYDLISNVKVGGVDMKDFPDFVDSYIESADYDGKPMTEEQLDELNKDVDFVWNAVHASIF